MKKLLAITIFIALLFGISFSVQARRGCCSHHGGVCSEKCSDGSIGYYCCDGSSLSDTCAPYYHECSYVPPIPKPQPKPEPKPQPEEEPELEIKKEIKEKVETEIEEPKSDFDYLYQQQSELEVSSPKEPQSESEEQHFGCGRIK